MISFGVLSELNELSTLFRILLAVLLGGAIGFERGRHGRPAGLRTHVLVCLGSALTSLTGLYLAHFTGMGDPSRIASGVVSGIGFLGAGMILVKNNNRVTGLTTAAALWATAAVGLAAGAGYYVGAVATALVIFLTTTLLTLFEVRQKKDLCFYLELDDLSAASEAAARIRALFPHTHNRELCPPKSGIPGHIGMFINVDTSAEGRDAVLAKLAALPHVILVLDE